jgi:hypothetical protein
MLASLVSLLPVKWQDKAKTIVAVLGLVLGAVVESLPAVPHWLAVVVAVLTALGVYATPNVGYVDPTVVKPQA